MSKRIHSEWLSLVPTSGPFLVPMVLDRVFPQGLDAHEPENYRNLRLAYEEWEDNQNGRRPNPAIHNAWIKFVLGQTLGFPDEVIAEGQAIPQTIKATVSEHGETLRPDLLVRNPQDVPNAGKSRLLLQVYPIDQDLEKSVAGRHWKATPATRMMELLHNTDIRLGLVTNGEHWMLVDAPRGETTGFASWYAGLWLEEKVTLQAFRSLLGAHRFFSVPEDQTLESMLAESATHQQEVTDQLGLQVRHAVEVLIQLLDRADQDHGRELLINVPEAVLYESALTVMMRLVFLFSAEERGLLLLGDPLYDQHYAVSTLVAQLQDTADQHGEEVLERRLDAWVRLLSSFRAVYSGVEHERMKLLPYGGNLFNPDRFPFLEGRKSGTSWRDTPANPFPVNNRTILHLLRSLQYLQMQGEARRLSFRALDIEQIGHVYEGLLDHTAKRATEPVLGLAGAKGREPEVPLGRVEYALAQGEDGLVEFLCEETGRYEAAVRKARQYKPEGGEVSQLRAACGNDDKLFKRVLAAAGLIRKDTFGQPVVIREGSVYVTEGTTRRSTGTHYTPRSLTEPIVQHTLEPLVYIGPAEGKPKEEWKLRSAKDLLDLKICDMACGSGAFLVQACRYLSELLVEAWEQAEAAHPDAPGITPEGTASSGAIGETLLPKDDDERLVYARRIIAQRCLYGVDKNPLAVEMAKLSLWLLTLAKDKPFTFLDHAIRWGDSLVGIHDLLQLKVFNLDTGAAERSLFAAPVFKAVDEAIALRKEISGSPTNTAEDVEAQERLLGEAEKKTALLRSAADLLLTVEFQPVSQSEKEEIHRTTAIQAGHYVNQGKVEEFRDATEKQMNGRITFHWPVEFPEAILDKGGFDALVCNPPFMGGQRITGNLGTEYRDYLVHRLAQGKRGSADLCAYFFLRAGQLLRENGQFGFLATNTIAQGDTREVGLEQLASAGFTIPRAVASRKWPGGASLEVAHVWIRRGMWNGPYVLEGNPVAGITPFLAVPGKVTGKPYRLAANTNKSFQGSIVLGMGFILEPEEAQKLLHKNPRNKDVLFPYLNGEDVNSRPDQSPSRWVINFFDSPLNRSAKGTWARADEEQRREWLRLGSVPADYPLAVAEDYPDCLSLVKDRVRPERLKNHDEGARRYWWRFLRPRPELYATITGMQRVLVTAAVSPTTAFHLPSPGIVFAHKLIVFALNRFRDFSVLQSMIHREWAYEYSSTLGGITLNYSPTDCFETFPFPTVEGDLEVLGKQYFTDRRRTMIAQREGLTRFYNRFHSPDKTSSDVIQIRELHVRVDNAVATAYGWTDIDLNHGFHKTKQGIRFTISEAARREVLDRLLRLNHERYEEEVRQGLHDKKGKAKTRTPGKGRGGFKPAAVGPLFSDQEPEDASVSDPGTTSLRVKTRGTTHPAKPIPKRGPASSKSTTEPPIPIEELETNDVMAAFRQAARGRGWMERDELIKEVSLILGYQRLSAKIEDTLRSNLRAAIRRKIIEAEGKEVRACTRTMENYYLEELRDTLSSVMRLGQDYEREDVIYAVAGHLGFLLVTETVRQSIKSAINSAIRQGILDYEGTVIWRK